VERRLERMRYPEVKRYLDRSDAIILPVGTTEAHGPHAPLGTDRFIAEATALLAAEKADALVAPHFAFTWAGATASLSGTVSLPAETVIPLVRQLCLALIGQGYRRVAVISGHAPDSLSLSLAVRAAFEQCGTAPIAFNTFTDMARLGGPTMAAMMEQERAMPGFIETSAVMAAGEVLGIEGLVDMAAPPYPPVAMPQYATDLMHLGVTVGYYYSDPSQHIPKPARADAALGRQYLEAAAAVVSAALEALRPQRA
jgi:creatinine amidohydrolase/Fe(II)-dependent formamide hydrolase-like protein